MRIAVVGPTASGKTDFALALAKRLGDRGIVVEAISADSMCVYRGMDIGTAKPTHHDRELLPTHCIDLVDPNEEFSVAEWQRAARPVLDRVHANGAAIMVGGTGLYVDAAVSSLGLPGQFPETRRTLEEELQRGVPLEVLHTRLAVLDPVAAARMEPSNERRILRALEVTVGSGRTFSSFGPGIVASYSRGDQSSDVALAESDASKTEDNGWVILGLRWDRSVLTERIGARFAVQLERGFLDEARSLYEHYGPSLSRTAAQALGYRELWQHLRGEGTFDEAVRNAVLRTRQFAVRQEKWFRRNPRVHWFDCSGGEVPEAFVDDAFDMVRRHFSLK